MSTALTAPVLSAIAVEMHSADRGEKTAIACRWAGQLGIHVATLYRKLRDANLIRGKSRKRAPEKPEVHEWAGTLAALSLKTPDGHAPVALHHTRDQAVLDGLVPPEAANIPMGTLYRILRETGQQRTDKKTRRLWARYPHQVVLFDASTSEYFSVVKVLDDGDFLLRLNTRVHKDYKNKPVGKERLRVLVYGVWDLHSGYHLSRYTAARGENGVDSMEFLLWAFGDKGDPRIPFEGVPQTLWVDQGPAAKLMASRDLLKRLGIDVQLSQPYEKERMGGVERTHRTRWGFERTFFLRLQEGKRFEILLSDLNIHLMAYLTEHANRRPARYQPALSREQAWIRGVNQMGGVAKLPPNALQSMATQRRCKVGRNGLFQLNHREYEVPTVMDRWVYVTLDMDGKPHVAEDVITGARYPVKEAQPVMVGEEFKGIADTPGIKARKAGQEIHAVTPLFVPLDGAGNVSLFPARKQPAAELENPLENIRYRTIEEALMALLEISGVPLTGETHATVKQAVIENGLSTKFVRELGLKLRAATAKRSALG